MSNLSELLPTGGGQNAVDFVATGTLTSGQTVALKTDGTVEVVSGVAESAGSPTVYHALNTTGMSIAYDAAAQKVVIAYKDTTVSQGGSAVVGTVSGATISFGTPVIFNVANVSTPSIGYDATAEKVVIAYRDQGSSNYGAAIVGTVSGTAISFGTAVVFLSAMADTFMNGGIIYEAVAGIVVIMNSGDPNYGRAIVGTVSGTSISFGTTAVFEAGQVGDVSSCFDSANGVFVVAYGDVGNSSYATAIVGTVSGTSISYGTPVVFAATAYGSSQVVFDTTNGKVVVCYRDSGGSGYATAIVGTVSGTAISFGTAVVFASSSVQYVTAAYDSVNSRIVAFYTDAGSSDDTTAATGTVAGTSISFETPFVVDNTAGAHAYTAAAFDTNAQKMVIIYNVSTGTLGTSLVYQVGASNNTDFIGITSEAISSAATGAVNVWGGINEVQTGLTIGSDYYVQADGTVTTVSASPAIKVGQAISTTSINLKDWT